MVSDMSTLGSPPAGLFIDLRERMVRIETKLDSHNYAHAVIDKTIDTMDKRITLVVDRVDLEAVKVTALSHEIALSRAKLATLASVGSAFGALVTFVATHFFKIS